MKPWLIIFVLGCETGSFGVPVEVKKTVSAEQTRAEAVQAYEDRKLQCALMPCPHLQKPHITWNRAWVCECVNDDEAIYLERTKARR